MPDFAVSTAFKAKDYITKAFSRMSKASRKFGDASAQAFQKASREGNKFSGVTKSILAAGAVQRGLGALEAGVTSVVGQFVSFDDAITGATVRFKDVGPRAADFNAQLAVMKQRAREAGATTEFSAAQAASALDFLARAGFSSTEAMGSLNSMINLSTATGEDFAQVADFSSDLLGAFGLAVADTAQKISNLNRLNDVLVATANSANVTVEDMFETMKVGAPVAVKFGATLEDVAAMTAIMGNAGIKGSQGATAIKNIFTRLAAPTKEVTDGLAALNLTQQDLIDNTGKMRGITDIMALIGDRLKGLAQPKQLGVLKDLFGSFALAGGANLVSSIQNVDKFKASLLAATDTAQDTADILRRSLGNQLRGLQSAAIEAGFKFLSAFDKDGRMAIVRLTDAVRKFDMAPVITGVRLGIDVIRALYKILEPFLPAIPVIIGGLVAFSTALKVQALIAAISAVGGLSGAMAILNAVMIANPIGAVIAAITALIAIGVLLVKNWGHISAGMAKIWDVIVKGVLYSLEMLKKGFIVLGGVLLKMFVDPVVNGIAAIAKGVLKLGSTIGKLTGLDVSGLDKVVQDLDQVQQRIAQRHGLSVEGMQAPNAEEALARRQQNMQMTGKIQVAGLPAESTGAAAVDGNPVDFEFLGPNL